MIQESLRNQNKTENTNQECIEQSKIILTKLFGRADHGLKRKAIALSKKLSKGEIEAYAVQLCQYSSGMQNHPSSLTKQKLLLNLISNELNIKM